MPRLLPVQLLERSESSFTLTLPVEPRGQGRARYSSRGGMVRAYTPPATRQAQEEIRHLWALAGSPEVPSDVFGLTLLASFKRPASHLTKSGELSAAGKRVRLPRPDVDNIVKLVLDALQGHAFANDSGCARVHASKGWGKADLLVVTLEW